MTSNYQIDINLIDLPIAICGINKQIVKCNKSFAIAFGIDVSKDPISLSEALGLIAKPISELIDSGLINQETQGIDCIGDFLCKVNSFKDNENVMFIITMLDRKEVCKENPQLKSDCPSILFDLSPVPIIEFDENWVIRRWSRKAEMAFGWSEEEVIGKKPTDWKFIYDDDTIQFDDLTETLVLNKQEIKYNRNYCKDGSVLHCEWTNTVICSEDGTINSIIAFATDVSELERTKKYLEYYTRFLESLINSIPFPIYYKNSAGEYKNYNKVFETYLLGSKTPKNSEFIIEDMTDIYSQQEIAYLKEKDALLLNNIEQKQLFEIDINCCDGVLRNFLLSKSQFVDFDGKVRGLVGVLVDITQLKTVSNLLEASQKSYSNLFQSSIDGIFYLDSSGKFLDANNSILLMLNCKFHGLLERNISEFGKDDLYIDLENIRNQNEFSLVRDDGSEIIISTKIWEDFDENGEIKGYWGIARDVSQTKMVEKLLIESQLRYDLAVRGSSDGLWDWDIETDKTWCSPRLLEQIGFKQDDVPSMKAVMEKVHPEDRESVLQKFNDYFAGAKSYKAEARMMTGTGEYSWFLSRGVAAFDADGKPYRMAGSLQNIDERKKHEEKEHKYIEKLKRSNNELQQFAYVASHDLQEPLRMISSFLQIINNRYIVQLDDDAKEFINFAIDGSVRMQQMINDLLAYSRVQSRANPFAVCDLNKIFRRAESVLAAVIIEKSSSILCDALPTDLECDENQIYQLFLNLIGNALKFSKADKKPKIDISCKEDNDFYTFSVKDNGIGIDQKYMERIFQIFQRLHTREEYEGTGIGLAICKKIVSRHGGKIWVESDFGSGSSFIFTLPKKRRSTK